MLGMEGGGSKARPLEFRGRFVESPAVPKNGSVWKSTKLYGGYTDLATQVPAKELRTIEAFEGKRL
jgi:hypothetical protein